MLGQIEQWIQDLGQRLSQMPHDDAGVPVLAIAVLSIVVALTGRHRRTVAETTVLAALSVALVGVWELPALIVAVGVFVHATQSGTRRASDLQFAALERKVAAASATVEDFLAALERRAREIDSRARDLEDLELDRTMETVSGLASSLARANGKAPDPAHS